LGFPWQSFGYVQQHVIWKNKTGNKYKKKTFKTNLQNLKLIKIFEKRFFAKRTAQKKGIYAHKSGFT